MTDGWKRVGATAVEKEPWIVAKVEVNGAMSYDVRREDNGLSVLARCGSFAQARKFTEEFDRTHG